MPYANNISGIYKITNNATQKCYVGQSVNINKRVREHFRLLKLGKHSNAKLQNAFNKHGAEAFTWDVEVYCEDPKEMDMIENAFISGEAVFEEPVFFNIADFAKAPMRGRTHSEEVRQRIRKGRRASTFDYSSEEYRKTLSKAQEKRFFSDPKFVEKVRYIVDHPNMSYAERARALGADTSAVRKLALRYNHLRGKL